MALYALGVDPWNADDLDNEGGSPPSEPEEEQETAERASSGRFGMFRRRLAQAVDRVGLSTATLGESLGRSALSTAEIIADGELRRKGADVVINGAQSTLQDLTKSLYAGVGNLRQGLSRGFQGASSGVAASSKQVQAVMARVQHRIQQQRLRERLRALQDDLVDVQIGPQLYEEAPQELRSRLWSALVQNPGLGMAAYSRSEHSAIPGKLSSGAREFLSSQPITPTGERRAPADFQDSRRGSLSRKGSRLADGDTVADGRAESADGSGPVSVDLVVNLSGDVRLALALREQPPPPAEKATAAAAAVAAATLTEGSSGAHPDEVEAMEQQYMELCLAARNKQAAPAAESPSGDLLRAKSSNSAVSLSYRDIGESLGEWDFVQDSDIPSAEMAGEQPRGSKTVASILEEYSRDHPDSPCSDQEGVMDSADVQRRLGGLLRAMWEIGWPLAPEVNPDGRYATLLQISIGQEDVDEVITRDIHRTFPEHPQFGLEDVGQAALFNVLKAYSLHDLEVGYCQGMAFVAGILLMYLPEEPAFQAFCDLMSTDGADLRRLYLPGLEELKFQLTLFEHLLQKFHPGISGHLKEHGIPPMLYVSQWFLTAFACPFPATFAARLIDVMLAEKNDIMLMRTALAVMAECEVEIMSLDDFEDIINHLKVEPCNWGSDRMRECLDVAVHGYLTEEDIREATELLRAEGAAPSPQPAGLATGTSGAACAQHEPQEHSADTSAGESKPAKAGSAVEQIVRSHSLERGGGSTSVGVASSASASRTRMPGELDLAAELETQKADMNEEYMAMVLALDMMLDGGDGSGSEVPGS